MNTATKIIKEREKESKRREATLEGAANVQDLQQRTLLMDVLKQLGWQEEPESEIQIDGTEARRNLTVCLQVINEFETKDQDE